MVEIGQPRYHGAMAYLDLAYRNPRHPDLGIEVFRLSELRRRMPRAFFTRVQRPRFHLLSLYIQGKGEQAIDFEARACAPGTVLHVHPGQVLRYLDVARAEALLVLFRPEYLRTGEADEGASHVDLPADAYEATRAVLEALEREYVGTDAGATSQAVMRHLLEAALLMVAREAAPGGPAAARHELFDRFRRELERSFKRTRKAQDYAEALGYAARTLNRAVLDAAGMPVKAYVDRRVALEARRLLAHTDLPVAAIAHELGFSEPTNFVKFFRRETGVQPGAFRAANG